MNLVKQRDEWKAKFENGEDYDSKILTDYVKYRNTEDWRSSKLMEEMCEYILFLENRLNHKINEENP
jgi:hypothetical protein